MSEDRRYTFAVEEGGERLDRFLAERVPSLSRAAVQRLIAEGEVRVDGAVVRASHKVRPGERVELRLPPPRPSTLLPEAIPLDILYEDEAIIVINKAAGMIVHPGAGTFSGTLVNAILAHAPDLQGIGGEVRPGIVHRLDKETSGVIVVAKTEQALRELQRQFKRRTVRKHYVALLIGKLPQERGLIEAPIGRHRVQRHKMAVVANGKEARTRWQVLRYLRDAEGHPYTFVEVELLTGRTHQIRVHFSWLGFPLVGDRTYAPRRQPLAAPRQCLHARDLTIRHPLSGKEMTFSAPLPDDFRAVLDALVELR